VTAPAASRGRLLRGPLLAAAGGAAALALLHLHDPHQQGAYGFCPFLRLTGLPCPGCGGLRAVNLLTNGEPVAAVSSNLFAVVLVGVLAVAWLVWTVRRARGRDAAFLTLSARTIVLLGVVVAVFGVVRLTPWGAWLAP